jgi:hypothetical protein
MGILSRFRSREKKMEAAKIIAECFDVAAGSHPDKSTEWLLSITADGLGLEYEDVVEALAFCADLEPAQ